MQRISMKMKLLSLAVLGLGGLALAGTASAACPAGPDAWSGTSTLAGDLSISSPGLDGSECKLDAKIIMNAPGSAFVRDDSPDNEPTYRAQFLFNADDLGAVAGLDAFTLFSASATNAVQGVVDAATISVVGNLAGTQTFLQVATPCSGEPGNICLHSEPIGSGTHTVEIQWVKGSSGSFSLWVDNNNESSPTWTTTANNDAWGGVNAATLGIALPAAGFRANHLNQVVSVDSFDSRRTTFIGF